MSTEGAFMPGSRVSFQNVVRHTADLLAQRNATLWVGEDVSSLLIPTGTRLLQKIARVTLHALQPLTPHLPGSEQVVERLQGLGAEMALSLADRSIGRIHPIAVEDPFDGVRQRLPEWQTLLQSTLKGMPGYVHRAIVTLAEAGYVARITTPNQDELLEQAAKRIGYKLPIINAVEGDPIPEGIFKSYLFKLHGTSSRPDAWPLDLHRLHLSCDSTSLAGLREMLESHPLLVLGYRGPDPFDLWPLLARSRLKNLVWADESLGTMEVSRFSPRAGPQILEGDFAERLLNVHGGWRLRGRLPTFLEAVCDALNVEVMGPAPDEDETALRDFDDLSFALSSFALSSAGGTAATGSTPARAEEQPLSPGLVSLGEQLRKHWVGAFALITWLDLWPEAALEDLFVRRSSLEQRLGSPKERAWFRYLLAQTGRPQVEEAFVRHFSGKPLVSPDVTTQRRLTRALEALDLSDIPAPQRPAHDEEVDVERGELGFALTGSQTYLPSPSQVTAEIPSFTHTERWHRMKAAGAVARSQWSVASQELSRALAQGGESGSPLMKLRARLALASVLHLLLMREDLAPLVGVLQALKRREPSLASQVVSAGNAVQLGAALALKLYGQVLEGYAIVLPTLQPSLGPVVQQYIDLAFQIDDFEPVPFFFDRDSERGRAYSFLPNVESALAEMMAGDGIIVP